MTLCLADNCGHHADQLEWRGENGQFGRTSYGFVLVCKVAAASRLSLMAWLESGFASFVLLWDEPSQAALLLLYELITLFAARGAFNECRHGLSRSQRSFSRTGSTVRKARVPPPTDQCTNTPRRITQFQNLPPTSSYLLRYVYSAKPEILIEREKHSKTSPQNHRKTKRWFSFLLAFAHNSISLIK